MNIPVCNLLQYFFFRVSRPFLNNVLTGRLTVKIKIQKFASREPDKCAILIFAGRRLVKSKIKKFASQMSNIKL
jgi:hypothetical protein